MTDSEITKEIVIAMVNNQEIKGTNGQNQSTYNASYVTEVCKAFDAVYQTVSKASISKYETD
ncbi:MAG: hypothetical protein ABFC57_12680 [Veillonellales bacterium]